VETKTGRNLLNSRVWVRSTLQHANSVVSHVGFNDRAYKICGQLVAYASDLHRYQFRVFSFSIALFGKSCRLLRWDRSGAIYTESFNWADGPLFEFLWRFNHLSAVDRGHDTTVSPVEDAEAEVALHKLWTYPKLEDLERDQLHKILVWDDRVPDEKPKSYVAAGPKWATDALIGRATFGYIAYDMETGNLVYLKDFWRVDHPGIQKEGDVYRELHEAEVPNIATMGRAGDVHVIREGSQLQDGCPLGLQRTRTSDYLDGSRSRYTWLHGRPQVEPYIHYRLVLETVGVPLNRFRSTRQLCEVIRDAVVGKPRHYPTFYSKLMLRSPFGCVQQNSNSTPRR
jgi:Fungal protein kinase